MSWLLVSGVEISNHRLTHTCPIPLAAASVPIAAVVGGIVGAIVVVILVILLIIFLVVFLR